ncbi:hypothetical protein [Kribbella sp.]|uniref:hypothetical protein n=1 Tax=Kribbella sp. TaxID=1871183 RepID=UPI002D60FCA1|nr:hypothetical protein [Kribbella sp.]HZX09004.1 hypothetical protein [Kribbella sp.]
MSDRRDREIKDALAYVAAYKDLRPWLIPVAECDPLVQRVYASIDRGLGHSHKRHAAMGDDTLYRRRVAYSEDPAQTQQRQRMMGFDGVRHDRQHLCGPETTRIHDAAAFAAAFMGVSEHLAGRRALDTAAHGGRIPSPVRIPISDLLGPDGHRWCSGFALAGDWAEALYVRKSLTWARWTGADLTDVLRPSVEQIPTFENGHVVVRLVPNSQTDAGGQQICTMTPEPLRLPTGEVRMEVTDRMWLYDKDFPFATILNFMETYLHPEIRYDNFTYLIRRVAIDAPDDSELATFKSEFSQLLAGDDMMLYPPALRVAAGYEDEGDDRQFLSRLWRKLYPLEQPPLRTADPGR